MVFATRHYSGESRLNVVVGTDIPIAELAEVTADVVGWDGEFTYDTSMPDGTPRKLVDTTAPTEFGWTASIGLREGIRQTYEWFLDHEA